MKLFDHTLPINFGRAPIGIVALLVVPMTRGGFLLAYRDAGADLCGIRDGAPQSAADQWIKDATAAGHAIERYTAAVEATPAGPQGVLPGAERDPIAVLVQRRAGAPLTPRKAQAACDVGLFSDARNQQSLF